MTNIHDGEPWESSPQITGKIKWEVIAPIDTEEIRMTLCSMKRTLVGMDKLSTQEVLTWHLPSLAGLMNIILATERLPSHLAMARVTFLPKVESPADPGDFRPTAISSVLARTLHKILSRRMKDRQRAIRILATPKCLPSEKNGCLEASALLCAVLWHSHEETKPWHSRYPEVPGRSLHMEGKNNN